MVGLSGVVGPDAEDCTVETVPPTVTEVSDTHRDAGVIVRSARHTGTGDQPAETPGGELVWVWGEVYSVTDGAGRRSVDPDRTAATCAAAYADHGAAFVERLDGEFAGLVYDPASGEATFFVDRLGARPLYVANDGERLAFSTNVQTVPELPGVDFGFDEAYLAEYLYARRTFGTKTPVDGIQQLPPATLLTYDADTGERERRAYWHPTYQPVDKPVSYFAREFVARFERAVDDRTDGERDAGLLLSGGSDSRAVLAAADDPPRCYHLGDGENRESRIARHSAEAAGAQYERLDRGPDYHETLLERARPIVEFVGPFHTGHALGFAEQIAGEVDCLLTGLYSDDLFGAWSVPQRELNLPFGVTLYPPFVDRLDGIDEFVDARVTSGETRHPAYLTGTDYGETLAANTRERDGGVDFHGVPYDSVGELSLHTSLFPVTNGIGFDLYSALQIAPTRNPFLDRRLVDLHLSMPLNHRLRHDVVQRAVASLSPALGDIPHSGSRVPMSYPKAAHVVGSRVTNQLDKLGARSYRTDGPWQDKNEVVRRTEFVGDALERVEGKMRTLDCLDADAAQRMYRDHRAGEANVAEELYRLITALDTPLADRLLDDR